MKIEKLERFFPHIVYLVRLNLLNFNKSSKNYDINSANDEIEDLDIEFLISYAYKEKCGIEVKNCRRLLSDYDELVKMKKEQGRYK